MKEQRWKGDYQTIPQEFAYSKMQEQLGLDEQNRSLGHDFIAGYQKSFDPYQRGELEMSASSQLDKVGMQPHAREYLETEMTCMRSDRKFEMIAGQMIDYPDGIQFSGRP